nr:translation initiation factor IF-2-like [Procambarus clarkii]
MNVNEVMLLCGVGDTGGLGVNITVLVWLLVAAADAAPHGYGTSGGSGGGCGGGQVRHVDGSCVTPLVTRNLFVYSAPDLAPVIGPRPYIPPPTVEHNILFIRAPESGPGPEPIVVPPPQQKNTLYVLGKRPAYNQQIIQVPAPEQESPDVYFVNYGDGDNPSLPTGEDLQSALRSAAQGGGTVIGGSGGGGGGGYGNGGGFGGGGSIVGGGSGDFLGGGGGGGYGNGGGFGGGGSIVNGGGGDILGGGGGGGYSGGIPPPVPQPPSLYLPP